MKYIVDFDHIVNAPFIDDCHQIERVEFDDLNIRDFSCTATIKCPKCGELLYASGSVKKIYDKHIAPQINWERHIICDKHNKAVSLQVSFEQAVPKYQIILKNFLNKEARFRGFLLSGAHGSQSCYYDKTKEIYLLKTDAISLFHEVGHAIFDLNREMLIGFINAFSTEGKNAKTIEKLKLFLEKKTNLSLKYSQCVSSGYFENHSI